MCSVWFAYPAKAQSGDKPIYIVDDHSVETSDQQAHKPVYIGKDSLTVYINNWLFSPNDDSLMALPDYNDSNWRSIRLGSYTKKTKAFFGDTVFKYYGIGWFRRHIYTDSTLAITPLSFELEQNFASEVYIDGKLIKKLGKVKGKDSVEYYTLTFPEIFRLDSMGHHVIAIRFADYHDTDKAVNEGDIVGLRFSISKANNAINGARLSERVLDIISASVMGVLGMLAALQFLLWLFRTKDKSNLFASILFLSMGISVVLGLRGTNSTNPDQSLLEEPALNVLYLLMLWGLSGFLNASFSKLGLRFRIITILLAIVLVLAFFDIPYYDEVTYILALLIMIESVYIVVVAMRQKVKGSSIIGVHIILLNSTLLITIPFVLFMDNVVIKDPQGALLLFIGLIGLLFAISFLSIPITISAYLARRYADLYEELGDQLVQVKELSEKNMAQEQEKKKILENQKHELELQVVERTKEIVEEKKKSDDLLLNILPAQVAEELKEKGTTKAKHFDEVSVMFTDFVDFTKTGERLTAEQLVNELDTCFKAFDRIMMKYGIEKIKTIGDAYMAVCGLPAPIEDHAERTVKAAKEILTFMLDRQQTHKDTSFRIRIGVHSGHVVAGIVGVKKFAYDIWGDTVNTAARMESNSEPNQINISEVTHEMVKDNISCTYRGEIEVKGKGALKMYFVD